jgi:quercetin dioxygenase-like cupin family protein
MEDGLAVLPGIGNFFSGEFKLKKGKVIHSSEVKPFILDEAYSSKMLLDESVASVPAININEGTLKGGGKTGGGVHQQNEIYYVVRGEAILHLDEETYPLRPGNLVFIPAGVFHSLDNLSSTEDFVLLTFWEKAEYNEVWRLRKETWGKTFKAIDEE